MARTQAPTPLIRFVAFFLFAAALFIVVYSLVRDADDPLMNFVLAGFLVMSGGGLLAASRGRTGD